MTTVRRLLVGLVTVLGTLALSVPSASATLTRAPYLQNLKPDSVVVMWRTATPQETRIRYREQGAAFWSEHRCTVPVTSHEIRIPNLKPDTLYEYQAIVDGDEAAQPRVSDFRTFPAGDVPGFQFVAYGDHRNNPRAHRSVVEAILRTAEARGLPRFVLDTGDLTGHGEAPTDYYDEQFFGPAQELMRRVCLFPVIGNHEVSGRPPLIPFRYFEYFSVPTEHSGTEYYYSFAFGDAHFCMIDGYSTDFRQGSKQHAWIDQDLRKSTKRWKFAVLHYPIYIHRSAPTVSYGNLSVREHLVGLFVKHGVTAVFSGDSHFYQRSEVDGIHYVCTGGGGAPLYTPGTDMPYVRASKSVYHYGWVAIEGDRMTLEAFDPENDLIDKLVTGPRVIVKPEPPPINFVRRMPDSSMQAAETIIVESRDADGQPAPASVHRETGGWMSSTAKSTARGLRGKGTRFSDNSEADAVVTIVPPVKTPGLYLISVTVPDVGSANAPNTLFTVTLPPATLPTPTAPAATPEQPADPPGLIRGRVALTASTAGGKWLDVGLFRLEPGSTWTLYEVEDEPDRFYFDAVRFTRYE